MTAPGLKSMDLQARVENLMLSYTITQHYENTTEKPIEIAYSFPVAPSAVITGFEATLAGITRKARAFPKVEAKEKYEESLEKGDAPIMLEVEYGTCSASLGNIKPGESADVKISFAEALEVRQGTVRINIPTVIGDRYEMDSDEVPEEEKEVTTNIFAHYACKGVIEITGFLARGRISSPTHAISVTAKDSGAVCVALPKDAALDRDITVLIGEVAGEGLTIGKDKEKWAAVASFAPVAETEERALALKILVDCSGSMDGDRIKNSKKALRTLAKGLKTEDTVTFTRFGSEYEHAIEKPLPCTKKNLRDVFLRAVRETDAEMGGTELEEALKAVMQLKVDSAEGSDILLITDGDVWGAEKLFKRARVSKCRIFIIGIGMAPGETYLGGCAELSGGAYEAVHTESEIEDAISRMFSRMRTLRTKSIAIDWGKTEPEYQSELPKSIFSGDSLTVYARFKEKPEGVPKLTWKSAGVKHSAELKATELVAGDDIAKLVAASEMNSSEDVKAQERIGCEYGLLGDATNLLLVIEREDADKVGEIPELVVTPQMPVADHFACMDICESLCPMIESHCMRLSPDSMARKEDILSAGTEPMVDLNSADYDEEEIDLYQFLTEDPRRTFSDVLQNETLMEVLREEYPSLEDLEGEIFLKTLAAELYLDLAEDNSEEADAIRDAMEKDGFPIYKVWPFIPGLSEETKKMYKEGDRHMPLAVRRMLDPNSAKNLEKGSSEGEKKA